MGNGAFDFWNNPEDAEAYDDPGAQREGGADECPVEDCILPASHSGPHGDRRGRRWLTGQRALLAEMTVLRRRLKEAEGEQVEVLDELDRRTEEKFRAIERAEALERALRDLVEECKGCIEASGPFGTDQCTPRPAVVDRARRALADQQEGEKDA